MFSDIGGDFFDELSRLRNKLSEFSINYPEIGKALSLSDDESIDPQTEYLIKSVSFLSFDLRKFIDLKNREIYMMFLDLLCKDLLIDFPNCSVVKFCNMDIPYSIPSGCLLRCENGLCRTLYNVNVIKSEISELFVSGGFLRFKIHGMYDDANVTFHLNCSNVEKCLKLYNALCNTNCAYCNNQLCSLEWLGFSHNQSCVGTVDYCSNSLFLFRDFCCFWKKFMFFTIKHIKSVNGIVEVAVPCDSNFSAFDLSDDSLLINCVPVVNTYLDFSNPVRVAISDDIFSFGMPNLIDCKHFYVQSIDGDSVTEISSFFSTFDTCDKKLSFFRHKDSDSFSLIGERVEDVVCYIQGVFSSKECKDLPVGCKFFTEKMEIGASYAETLYLFTHETLDINIYSLLFACCYFYYYEDYNNFVKVIQSAFHNKNVEECGNALNFVEVKNVTIRSGFPAKFIDAKNLIYDLKDCDNYFILLFINVLKQFCIADCSINNIEMFIKRS